MNNVDLSSWAFDATAAPSSLPARQQFLADSPWEPTLLVRACAERVAPEIDADLYAAAVRDGRQTTSTL